jgi:hypothetical protein
MDFAFLVPLASFWAAYATMYANSRADKGYALYTLWTYTQVLFLVPAMFFFPLAREIALVNTLGLGVGVHFFYIASNYGVLRDFGNHNGLKGRHFAFLLIGDFVVHMGPWLGLQCIFSNEYTLQFRPALSKLWIGVMTGLCHSTYTFALGYGWDPGPLYNIKAPYNIRDIYFAWIGLFLSHVFATTVVIS